MGKSGFDTFVEELGPSWIKWSSFNLIIFKNPIGFLIFFIVMIVAGLIRGVYVGILIIKFLHKTISDIRKFFTELSHKF